MAWLSQFKLGRPGAEILFDVNPESMQIDDSPIAVVQRNLSGDLKKSVIRSYVPTVRIHSSYLTVTQRSQFSSLANVTDTFLSFLTRDSSNVSTNFSIFERYIPTDTSHITLRNNSNLRLVTLYASLGLTWDGVIWNYSSVYQTPDQTGTNYGNAGFDPATLIWTTATPLPNLNPVYVEYRFAGWLVNMDQMSQSIQGGWLDRFQYDITLTGA
jgi:hypothetical protein